MPIITLTETKELLGIDLTRAADRVRDICRRPFTVQKFGRRRRVANRDGDLYVLQAVDATFDASSATITVRGENFASAMFAAGQDIFIRDSYFNDGYYTIASISTSTLTITSTYSAASSAFVDEATGATMYIGVVIWPPGIKPLVASMIQFDYQERGTWKEGEAGGFGVYGYPLDLLREFDFHAAPAYGTYTHEL
jgi:hypothetical protein